MTCSNLRSEERQLFTLPNLEAIRADREVLLLQLFKTMFHGLEVRLGTHRRTHYCETQRQSTRQPRPTVLTYPNWHGTNSGLGLSLNDVSPLSSLAQLAPPRPAHSPPPPPVKQSIDLQIRSLGSSEALFNDEQYSMHPARSHSPVIQIYEQSLEDRYATSIGSVSPGSAESVKVEGGQPDTAKQALIKRYRILEELLTTEHQFCIDMMIAHNIFEATAQNLMSEKEKKMLFSNCKELEKVFPLLISFI